MRIRAAALMATVVGLAVSIPMIITNAGAHDHLVRGGPPEAENLLSDLLSKVSHESFSSVELSSPPSDLVAGGFVDEGALWMTIHASLDRPLSDTIFRADLLAAGFNVRATADITLPLSGYSLNPPADGSAAGATVKLLPRTIVVPDIDQDLAASRKTLTDRFRVGAGSVNGEMRDLRFSEIPRLAVEVTIAVPNPEAFVRGGAQNLHAIVGTDDGYDAREVTLTDMDGNVFLVSGFNLDLSSGSTWIRPDLVADANLVFGAH